MPQGLPTVIPNEVIASSHINSIADRVVGRFANATERNTAIPTPVAGMVTYRTDIGGLEVYTGGAWARLAGTRTGCRLEGTISPAAGASGDIPWTTEHWDTDGFHAPSSTDIVIPAGLAGVYQFGVTFLSSVTLNGNSRVVISSGASINFVGWALATNNLGSADATVELAAGSIVKCNLFNGHSGPPTWTCRLWMVRLST